MRRTHYSTFDTSFLARRLEAEWGLRDATCEFWGRHLHDTYRVNAKGLVAYLRVYRRQYRTLAEILGEVTLLRFLHQRGAAVAYPLPKRDGGYVDRILAAEGTRHAVLFAEAKGRVPRINSPNCKQFGRFAASIHVHADAYRGRIPRPTLGMDHIAWEPLRHVAAFLRHRPRDVAYLQGVARELAPAIESLLPTATPEFGICHGDLHLNNVNRDNRGRFTLFDFDCAGYGWRAHDIAVFLWSRGWDFTRSANLQRARHWNAFLEGYGTVRALTAAELEAAHLFVPLHQIWVIGTWISLRSGFGRRWLSDSHLDTYIAFIKQWPRVHRLSRAISRRRETGA